MDEYEEYLIEVRDGVTSGGCHEGEYKVHQTPLESLTTNWNQWPTLKFGDQR